HFEALRQELLSTGEVEHVGLSTQTMLNIWNNGWGWKWEGKAEDADILISNVGITTDLFPALNITLNDGRNFEPGDDNAGNVIINKVLADMMGDAGYVGGRIWRGGDGGDGGTIVGIINDFVYNDIYNVTQRPALFRLDGNGQNLFIRLKAGNMQAALQQAESIVKRIDPAHPFEYRFMDEQFNAMFKSTLLVGKLAGLFAVLAIFISCLGLFGLVAFAAEQRTREIGIRKVLGASVPNIVELLMRNFMILIGISFVIAIPVAWWIMHGWLQNYEYRIVISWWEFAGSGILVILIAILTVGFQAIKAATANPVRAIKSE
ncbi:MAG: ABC transporter permease, partial [Tannerella sp.]|nr:ABC transporter permease [Tannerella sp.]